MDAIDPVWLFSAIALVIGFALGALVRMWRNPAAADAERLKRELEQVRSEMEVYRASVNRHFSRTSELVNELTQDYVQVYQHLAEGAQQLGDSAQFNRVLEQSRGRVLISMEDERDEAGVIEAATETGSSSAAPRDDRGQQPDDAAPAGDRPGPAGAAEAAAGNNARHDPVIGGDARVETEAAAPGASQKVN